MDQDITPPTGQLKLSVKTLRTSKWKSTIHKTKQVLVSFLRINPNLTLRKALKQRIDEICLWLDIEDKDTK